MYDFIDRWKSKYILYDQKENIMGPHPAEIFRNRRAKFLAIARTKDYRTAYYILEKEYEEGKFDAMVYHGLLGELIFNQEKENELDLTPTLDYGDHCDYRGEYNNAPARFDVTTSLEFKNLEDYEPFQKKGKRYFIALVDTKKRKVDRIVDINFPFCGTCGGRIVNVAHIGRIEHTDAGSPTQTERVIKVCSKNIAHNIDLRQFEYFIPSMLDEQEYLHDIYSDNEEILQQELSKVPLKHGINTSLFFSKLTQEKVHAVGHDVFTPTDKDGDGFLETKLYWQSDMVEQLLPPEFGEQL